MSITNLQDKPIVIGTPVEIGSAINKIRTALATIPWLERAYFIAERFQREINGRKYMFPETYAPTAPGRRDYVRLTPDNDFKGRSFFMVGRGSMDHDDHGENRITYPVSIIVSANLDLIDKDKLDAGLFTDELIRDVRSLLTTKRKSFLFEYSVETETRDLRDVFREFSLENIEDYNRAPMQSFRFDLSVTVQQDCNY
jgi:hypothetical protein